MPLFNKFQIALGKFDIETQKRGYKLRLRFRPLGKKLDYAQLALDTQVWEDVQRYMPVGTGGASGLVGETNTLNASVLGSGKVYIYPPNHPYGHYQHEGIVYKDPVYNVGGFFSPKYGWWSRKGVEKVPSTQLIKYSQPNARRYWGKYAIDHHHKQWYDTFRKAMR
jgi:hypothetical protein